MRRVIDAPSTYIQGPGEIKKLAEHYRSIGEGEVLLIMDRFVHDVYREAAAESFEKEEISWKEEVFTGECSEPEITRLAGLAENCGAVFGMYKIACCNLLIFKRISFAFPKVPFCAPKA